MAVDNKNNAAHNIPQFSLYGEESRPDNAEFVHIELIETRSRLYDWHIGMHTHRGLFQVLFLMSGHVSAVIDSQTWEHDGPVAITIHPSVVHAFTFSEEAQGFVLTVDQNVIFSLHQHQHDNHLADLFTPLFVRPIAIDLTQAPDIKERLEALLRHLIAESAWPLTGHTLMLEWLSRSALLLLLRLHHDHTAATHNGHRDFELFSRFRSLIELHYKDQWVVAQYATQLHITPTRLNRLCIKLSGNSAFDMTQQRLILEACRKLTYLSTSVASVAYELGFQDPAYFSRLFKRHTHLTPKAYRDQSLTQAITTTPPIPLVSS